MISKESHNPKMIPTESQHNPKMDTFIMEDESKSIDWLADRVQSLLGKSLTLEHDLKLISKTSIRLSNDTSKAESESKNLNQELSSSTNPSITELLMNINNEYDDLTEYYPIEKIKTTNHKKIDLILLNSDVQTSEEISMSTINQELSTSKPNQLTNIITFHKQLLNVQMEQLKKLNDDLLRIERYLNDNQNNNHANKHNHQAIQTELVNSLIDHNKIIRSSLLQEPKQASSFKHSKKREENRHRNHGNSNYNKTTIKPGCQDQPKIKQQQIIKTCMADMINKIDKLLNVYDEMQFVNSIQMSQKLNQQQIDHQMLMTEQIDNQMDDCNPQGQQQQEQLKREPLSWFLNFGTGNPDNQPECYYRIEPSQQYNSLQEMFERNCMDFKIRSQLRTSKIKDNCRLRIETANKRQDEIVQVFMMKKANDDNVDGSKIELNRINYNNQQKHRPLSPTHRHVFTHRQMRTQTERLYQRLPEYKNKMNNGKKEDDAKRRRIMADIFKQKLKDNAVRGKLNWPITSQAIYT